MYNRTTGVAWGGGGVGPLRWHCQCYPSIMTFSVDSEILLHGWDLTTSPWEIKQRPSAIIYISFSLTRTRNVLRYNISSIPLEPRNALSYNLCSILLEPRNALSYNLCLILLEPRNSLSYNLCSILLEPRNALSYNLCSILLEPRNSLSYNLCSILLNKSKKCPMFHSPWTKKCPSLSSMPHSLRPTHLKPLIGFTECIRFHSISLLTCWWFPRVPHTFPINRDSMFV